MAPSAVRGALARSGPLAAIRDHWAERYEGVIQVFWLGDADGPVKVVGSIDDGGWRTFVPLSKDFTVMPQRAMPTE